jgi:cell division protein FtsW
MAQGYYEMDTQETSSTGVRTTPASIRRGSVDVTMMATVAALVSIGLLTIYGTSALHASFDRATGGNSHYFFQKQASGAVIGTLFMVAAMRIDYDWYRRRIYWLLGGAFGLLSLTAVPGLSKTAKGASRWVELGPLSFQPAEIVKIVIVMYAAYSITKKADAMKNFFEAFVAHTVVMSPFLVLLLMQPDFGSSVVISAIVGLMLFVGGARMSYMAGLVVMGGVAVFWLISQRAYRLERVMAWLDPWKDASDTGYQLVNSYIALASGGFSGTGFGEGRGKLGYLPELYNDFVAASVGEELGLVGIALLCTLFVVFLWRGYVIAFEARDSFGAFLAFGLTTLIGMQAGINLCVVTGILPTKGLTLPFVSSGRTSLIIVMFAVGVLLNISQRNPDLSAARLSDRERNVQRNTLRVKELEWRTRRRDENLKTVS